MLENQDLDFAVGDMAKELKISRPKAYEVIRQFEKKDYVKKSRVVGKTQLYKLNKENLRVKLLLRDFRECLKLVTEEHWQVSDSMPGIGAVSSRNI
jgi:sugar-specific transcriptional regulator TrmB